MFNVNQARGQQQQQPSNQQLQQRSMPSPGTTIQAARQSFSSADAFPPPVSPTATQFSPVPNNQQQNSTSTPYTRLQRVPSAPTTPITQLSGISFIITIIYQLSIIIIIIITIIIIVETKKK